MRRRIHAADMTLRPELEGSPKSAVSRETAGSFEFSECISERLKSLLPYCAHEGVTAAAGSILLGG
jgi:hypothetical protein